METGMLWKRDSIGLFYEVTKCHYVEFIQCCFEHLNICDTIFYWLLLLITNKRMKEKTPSSMFYYLDVLEETDMN